MVVAAAVVGIGVVVAWAVVVGVTVVVGIGDAVVDFSRRSRDRRCRWGRVVVGMTVAWSWVRQWSESGWSWLELWSSGSPSLWAKPSS